MKDRTEQIIERGLETPRRVAAVSQLISMGWWWDGKKWMDVNNKTYDGKGNWIPSCYCSRMKRGNNGQAYVDKR